MKKKLIVVLIVLLAIGFAAVTTTLFINGTMLFAPNEEDFDIYFSKAVLDEVDVSGEVISSDGKTITYETKILEVVGDNSVLDYTVTNNSSNYDAKISVNCVLEGNDYVIIDNTLQEAIIEAKSEESGTLTATLIKTSVEEREYTVECTINAEAIERDTRVDDPIVEGESSTYSLYGYLVDENDNPLPNTAVVAYSDPVYGVSDDEGYIYLEGMETGSHTLYVMGEKTVEELQNLSKEEIETIALTNVGITTNTINVVFPNGDKIVDSVIEKTKIVEVILNTDGGELNTTSITATKGLAYGELPTPTREGYTFEGWYNDDEKVDETTKVIEGESHSLTAKWKEKLVTVVSGTGSSVGDILAIGTEQFYVISNDGTNVVMMARYNLYVSGEYNNSSGVYTTYTSPTGIQDSTMLGWTSGGPPYKGVVAFGSNTTYSGSIVEGYVNNYSNYIKNVLGVANTATLITKDELDNLGCTSSTQNCRGAPSWIYSTSYWTRTGTTASSVYYVYSDSQLSHSKFYTSATSFGVRPLITVSVDLI